MNRKEFIRISNEKLKLIRTEYNFTQDKMAEILGISKKTLIEIEKGRSSLGWSGSVVLCTVFHNSEIIEMTFGGQPSDIILNLAFDGDEYERPQTMGGKVWWYDVKLQGEYKIQKNMISGHYRILDGNDKRISSSFDYDYIDKRFQEVVRL